METPSRGGGRSTLPSGGDEKAEGVEMTAGEGEGGGGRRGGGGGEQRRKRRRRWWDFLHFEHSLYSPTAERAEQNCMTGGGNLSFTFPFSFALMLLL